MIEIPQYIFEVLFQFFMIEIPRCLSWVYLRSFTLIKMFLWHVHITCRWYPFNRGCGTSGFNSHRTIACTDSWVSKSLCSFKLYTIRFNKKISYGISTSYLKNHKTKYTWLYSFKLYTSSRFNENTISCLGKEFHYLSTNHWTIGLFVLILMDLLSKYETILQLKIRDQITFLTPHLTSKFLTFWYQ